MIINKLIDFFEQLPYKIKLTIITTTIGTFIGVPIIVSYNSSMWYNFKSAKQSVDCVTIPYRDIDIYNINSIDKSMEQFQECTRKINPNKSNIDFILHNIFHIDNTSHTDQNKHTEQ